MPEVFTLPDGVRLVLARTERDLLVQLTSELRSLLTSRRIDRGEPIYDRLFPSVYEDAKDEAAYRELIGDDLERHKIEALDLVGKALDRRDIAIVGDDFESWVQVLTDLRLAIGTRLDVDEERMAEMPSRADPDGPSLEILHWLGWIQQSLIEARIATA